MARYDRYHGRYDDEWRRAAPHTMWYPGAYWAGAPMFGWGWGAAWGPDLPLGYEGYPREYYEPRRRPEDSPTYGTGGDAAARRYAISHGYDEGYAIRPRRPPYRGGPNRGGPYRRGR